MSLGLGAKFNILHQSPHDFASQDSAGQQQVTEQARWVPSRFNVRATTTDGRLVLWNSYTGTMTVFPSQTKEKIEILLSQKGFYAPLRGAVKYLVDRGYLLRQGTDEYRRVQVGFGIQHYRHDTLELILLASEDCNLRCQYCYEDFARGTMKPAVRKGIKRLLEKRLSGLRRLSVQWFGGEPLYGFAAIEELAPFFLQTARDHNIRFTSSMTTNGFLLTPDMAEKLLGWGINSFQITIDGRPEDHDHNRPTRDGKGTFEQIFNNLKEMRNRSEFFMVDLRINFDQRNAPHISSFLDLVQQEFQLDRRFRLRFRAIGRWGGPNDQELDVCGVDDASAIQAELQEQARKRNLQISDDIRQVSGMGAHVCYAARPYNFIVGATGKLMKCTIDLDKEDRNVVGRLTEEGELKLDFDRFSLWTQPSFEHDTKCQKCVVLPVCQGAHCPLIRIESAKSPCTPLRKTAKKDLLATVEQATSSKRRSVNDGSTVEPTRPPHSI